MKEDEDEDEEEEEEEEEEDGELRVCSAYFSNSKNMDTLCIGFLY